MRLARTGIFLAAAMAVAMPLARADERADAEKALEKAIGSKDRDAVSKALLDATKAGDERAAKLILSSLPKLKGLDVHSAILDAIKQVKDDAGIKELAGQAKSNGNAELRFVLIEGLACQGSDAAAKAVLDGLDDKDELVSNVAARSARMLGKPDTIDRLIARLEKAESKPSEAVLAREILGALSSLTGESLSFALEWKGWWMSHKEGWKPKTDPSEPSGGTKDGGSVIDRLKKERPSDAHTMERLGEDDVIVVKGHSDQVQDVLRAINVKHKLIDAEELKNLKLDPKSVLILNCNSRNNPYGDLEWSRIREFVDKGGYLFTSDWQLEFLLPKVFTGTIEMDKKVHTDELGKGGGDGGDPGQDPKKGKGKGGKGGGGGKGGVVPVSIMPTAAGGKHPLMRDVFPATSWDASKFVWQLDNMSELIKILSPEVTVLVESPDLKKQYNNGAVAVTFRWHNGRIATGAGASKKQATGGGENKPAEPEGGCVLHVLGHFKHQKDADSGDHFALQQLLLNFILEKQHARHGS